MLDPGAAPTVLAEIFGHADFRGGQRAAVDALLGGRDAMVLLPTGAGKSVCYQVPAVVAHRSGRGTTVVISPLIALMADQVAALAGKGVAVAAIHSHQGADEQRAVAAAFQRRELALLYVSPERAALASFRRLLARVPVAFLAIDEAHCVSQWGHDFRPEYLRLHELRAVVAAPVIALTATATPRVLAEIAGALELRDPLVVRGDFSRPNLAFGALHLRSDAERVVAVIEACDRAGLRARTGPGRAIVYTSTRKKAETVAQALKKAGFAAGHYHAGRTPLARQRAQGAFALGRARVLCATNAFGMGVDYPDVRLIVHFQAPGSLEAYYQEAGRAGRDGAAARCLLLFGAADLALQRRQQSGERPNVEEALAAVEDYAFATRCRQQVLCAHFTGADAGAACGSCDVCLGTAVAEEHHSSAAPAPRRAPPRPRRAGGLAQELAAYRRRMARQLGWKQYMVFQRRVILAVDDARPTSHAALARIVGLGPAKIARFGDDLLAMVRRHARDQRA
jgi:ATP-dependent DNA helicase RecQ